MPQELPQIHINLLLLLIEGVRLPVLLYHGIRHSIPKRNARNKGGRNQPTSASRYEDWDEIPLAEPYGRVDPHFQALRLQWEVTYYVTRTMRPIADGYQRLAKRFTSKARAISPKLRISGNESFGPFRP